MKKLLVSACLLGDKVRYDGKGKFVPEVHELRNHFELLLFCPEFSGLKKAPRQKIELVNDELFTEKGLDVTLPIKREVDDIIRLCKHLGIRHAVLKSHSPTCGKGEIYDGTFTGKLTEGNGLFAKALLKNGFIIYSENEIEKLLIDFKIITPPENSESPETNSPE